MRKQNIAGRIALAIATVLLCAVFVTTSVLSTTFAKYTTTGEIDSETARVAKWGIKLSNSSNADTEWSVVENENSIMAASSGSTDNIIAPGTSGYLACFRVEGNPEVAHDVTMNFNVTIGNGYKNLIGQDDYFPILISVGRASYNDSDAVIDRNELHYYVPKSGIDTLENLISSVDSETFTDERIAPNGWSGIAYAEYYVRWDWFYNAYDVPSYIPPDVKTALTAYQRWGDDTLLSKAMVLQLGKEKVKGKVDDLVDALEDANKALSGTPEKEDVETLETALATYLGVDARSYTIGEVTRTYNPIQWGDLISQGAMDIHDEVSHAATNYRGFFNVYGNETGIFSKRSAATNRDLCYFTTLNSSFPLTDSTYYEMTFKAANYKGTQYAGVVFAANKPATVNKLTWRKPYFFYGGLGGTTNNVNDTDPNKNYNYACLEICHGTFRNASTIGRVHKDVKYETITNTDIDNTARQYGSYRVVYDGLTITCYYKDTSGNWTSLGSFTADSGTTLAVGVQSRDSDGYVSSPTEKQRTMILREVVITQKTVVTAKSVLQGLVKEVQAIVDAHSTERDFTISANATIAITQTKSEPNP